MRSRCAALQSDSPMKSASPSFTAQWPAKARIDSYDSPPGTSSVTTTSAGTSNAVSVPPAANGAQTSGLLERAIRTPPAG
ncbi:hypothetical protein D3C83_110310 [compost metagenome]